MLKPKRKLTRREMKEDKLVTFWFQAIDFIQAHMREIAIGVIAVAVVIGVSAWHSHQQGQNEESASVVLAKARSAYDSQQLDLAIKYFGEVVNSYENTTSAELAMIMLANAFMQKAEYQTAEEYYRKFLDNHGSDPVLSAAAAAGVAATYDERGEYLKAGELYEQAARKYAKSYRAPELLMRAARCFRLVDNSEATLRVINLLLEKYPKSDVIEDAKLVKAEMQS